MNDNNAVVAIYASHTGAEAAIKELRRCGFDMKKLSIVASDQREHAQTRGYYQLGQRMECWGGRGAFWGGIWGMLFGSALFIVPGFGPLLIAGPLVGTIVGILEATALESALVTGATLAGAVLTGGLGVIGAALWSLGIPEEHIARYETDLRAGKFVVVAHGTPEETIRARDVIDHSNPERLEDHQLPIAKAGSALARV